MTHVQDPAHVDAIQGRALGHVGRGLGHAPTLPVRTLAGSKPLSPRNGLVPSPAPLRMISVATTSMTRSVPVGMVMS